MSPLRLFWLVWADMQLSLVVTIIIIQHSKTNDDSIAPWAVLTAVTCLAAGLVGLFGVRCPGCRLPLSDRKTALARIIPGPMCPQCGEDLKHVSHGPRVLT